MEFLPSIKLPSFSYTKKQFYEFSITKFLAIYCVFKKISSTFELHRLIEQIVPKVVIIFKSLLTRQNTNFNCLLTKVE